MFPSLWPPYPPPSPLHTHTQTHTQKLKGSSAQYVSAQKNIVFPYVKSPFPFPLPVYGQLPWVWHSINQSVSNGHSRIRTSRSSSRAPFIEVRGQGSLQWNTLCVWGSEELGYTGLTKESDRWNKMKDERESRFSFLKLEQRRMRERWDENEREERWEREL